MPVGCATISGIAVLENPRSTRSSGKTILFDVHFFIYDTPDSDFAGVSLLRYFNNGDFQFREVEKYFVHAEVAIMDEKCSADFLTPETSREDYFMVGDILQLIPADPDLSKKDDTKYPPFLTIGAVVDKVNDKWNQTPRTFHIDLDPNVYIQLLQPSKEPNKSNESQASHTTIQKHGSKQADRIYGHMPVCCFVPDSRRWPSPPTVKLGNYVTAAGYLQCVIWNDKKMVTSFEMELERITYMGHPSASQTGSPPVFKRVAGAPAGSSTPPQKRMKFSYTYQNTPTPASRKRMADQSNSNTP
ncbi:hypothetical protein K435DRAFT_789872 [Dendrothele bispora CBS 962.96]|uniref:Uncharacterized protein n=1 Tax=Dendrothele bispora (strain CBS 962.96) TaxID=1314807 RepID=A0A4S8MSK4_DENBC|nr:hypothetical protein K435DRAFT_789872 [Dendrothele bispora CBS 962.96]